MDGMKVLEDVETYNELPRNAKKYIETLREITGVEVSLLSTSPEREDTILFKDPF